MQQCGQNVYGTPKMQYLRKILQEAWPLIKQSQKQDKKSQAQATHSKCSECVCVCMCVCITVCVCAYEYAYSQMNFQMWTRSFYKPKTVHIFLF